MFLFHFVYAPQANDDNERDNTTPKLLYSIHAGMINFKLYLIYALNVDSKLSYSLLGDVWNI